MSLAQNAKSASGKWRHNRCPAFLSRTHLLKKIGFEWPKEQFDEDSILDIEFRNQERIEVENNDDIAASIVR